MSIWESIVLGIIQGLTEFLPVSSSGHIELGQAILGTASLKEQEELLSVVLHAATALATILVFRKDIVAILKGLFSKNDKEQKQFTLFVIVSMVPAVIVGLFFDEVLEQLFEGQVLLVCVMLLLTGALLLFAEKTTRPGTKKLTVGKSLLIGIAQAIAILPGISRSGATISTSILLNIDRSQAARFSFLMVVPLIIGKMAKDVLDGKLVLSDDLAMPFAVGFVAALVSGIIACQWMIAIVKKSKLSYFAYYCFVVGAIGIIYSLV
ncbi:undecaprenyl-diphosphate phosphatase [Bacteroidia bacterium]|jgi:undecaprenyl-diphosphatase|nr:undecaprenyl-diphosphate phosphatase [Bacteroidia bacterium]MDB4174553.1 undecaprenyl-diphosphate phosphatase [Bacteroidia bacterium]